MPAYWVTGVEPVGAVVLEDQVRFGGPGECCDSATLTATRQPMRADSDSNGDASDGNADGNAPANES